MIPTLKCPRLFLRPVNMDDLANIHELHSHPEVDEFNTLGIPEDIEVSRTIVEQLVKENSVEEVKNYTFSIFTERERFVGLVAINLGKSNYRSAEIWYKLNPNSWNRGYATESVTRILKFGFKELGLYRIEAGCAVENQASIKVLEKVGMMREGRKRAVLPLKSGWSDNYMYAILEDDR